MDLNPHLDTFFVGVVTSTRRDVLPEHRIAIGAGQLSVHAANRADSGFAPVRPMVGAADFLDTLADRMPPETVACLVPRKVAVFGAGSLGSMIAETMVRNGVSAFHLVDPDRVEAVNLSRSAYNAGDIGDLKVDALANRLLSDQPTRLRHNPGQEPTTPPSTTANRSASGPTSSSQSPTTPAPR